MRIDAHHHFWHYDPVAYDWIDDGMRAIRRDFLPADLDSEIRRAGIDGVVSVQARQSLEETAMLLGFAGDSDFIRGVVGWVPLVSPRVEENLEEYAASPKLRGVRHVLQGEPDDLYMLRDDFNAGVRALKRFGLVYDILILARHLPQTATFVDRHPGQIFVLDHLGKPGVKAGLFEPWNRDIRELAKRENVYCKLSGLVTEAVWPGWTPEQLRPYVETVLEAFGPARTMFGSDWPVCLVATEYGRWHETVQAFAAHLSPDEQAQLFGGTVRRAYQI